MVTADSIVPELVTETINSWELGHKLAEGASGEVYLARRSGYEEWEFVLKRPGAATKVYLTARSEEIKREFDALSSVRNSTLYKSTSGGVRIIVPTPIELGEFKGYNYLVTTKAVGKTIAELNNRGICPATRALFIILGMIRLLKIARLVGWVYNDIKVEHLYWDPLTKSLTMIDWANSRHVEDPTLSNLKISHAKDEEEFRRTIIAIVRSDIGGTRNEDDLPNIDSEELDYTPHIISILRDLIKGNPLDEIENRIKPVLEKREEQFDSIINKAENELHQKKLDKYDELIQKCKILDPDEYEIWRRRIAKQSKDKDLLLLRNQCLNFSPPEYLEAEKTSRGMIGYAESEEETHKLSTIRYFLIFISNYLADPTTHLASDEIDINGIVREFLENILDQAPQKEKAIRIFLSFGRGFHNFQAYSYPEARRALSEWTGKEIRGLTQDLEEIGVDMSNAEKVLASETPSLQDGKSRKDSNIRMKNAILGELTEKNEKFMSIVAGWDNPIPSIEELTGEYNNLLGLLEYYRGLNREIVSAISARTEGKLEDVIRTIEELRDSARKLGKREGNLSQFWDELKEWDSERIMKLNALKKRVEEQSNKDEQTQRTKRQSRQTLPDLNRESEELAKSKYIDLLKKGAYKSAQKEIERLNPALQDAAKDLVGRFGELKVRNFENRIEECKESGYSEHFTDQQSLFKYINKLIKNPNLISFYEEYLTPYKDGKAILNLIQAKKVLEDEKRNKSLKEEQQRQQREDRIFLGIVGAVFGGVIGFLFVSIAGIGASIITFGHFGFLVGPIVGLIVGSCAGFLIGRAIYNSIVY